MGQSPPGWYTDPTGRYERRYWSGQRWTRHVVQGRERAEDPITVQLASAEPPHPRPKVVIAERTSDAEAVLRQQEPRSRRVGAIAGAAVVAVAVLGLFAVARGGGDGGGADDTTDAGESDQSEDPLDEYLRAFILVQSGGAIDDRQAACMSDNLIATMTRERLMEAEVMGANNPFVRLTPEESVRALSAAFSCLDDDEVVDYLSAQWDPARFGGLPTEMAPCMFRGLIEGWGRQRTIEVVGLLTNPAESPTLDSILTPEENDVVIDVVNACGRELEGSSSTTAAA